MKGALFEKTAELKNKSENKNEIEDAYQIFKNLSAHKK